MYINHFQCFLAKELSFTLSESNLYKPMRKEKKIDRKVDREQWLNKNKWEYVPYIKFSQFFKYKPGLFTKLQNPLKY